MKHLFPIIALLTISITLSAQNVGIGTLEPDHKLDVRSRLDTTLRVTNVGVANAAGPDLRIGILNIIDQVSGGSRTGIKTSISFPSTVEAEGVEHVGHEVRFNGFCLPGTSGCNNSDLFGVKVDIPFFTNAGENYGIYSYVPGGYAGYFDGKSYFSRNMGIGVDPTFEEKLNIIANQTSDLLLRTGMKVFMLSGEVTEDVEGALVSTNTHSTTGNFGTKVLSVGRGGPIYGVYSRAFHFEQGPSYGMFTENYTAGGSRTGIRSEVTGDGAGTVNGIQSYISSNAGSSTIYGLRSNIISGTTTGTSYGVYASNNNSSSNAYSGFFKGKASIVGGEDASLSGDGFLRLGYAFTQNLILDDNEIMAKNNSAAATLYLQNDGGDILMCSGELGGVGIGILNASSIPNGYLLAVDGKGVFEELRVEVSTSWPDYVFEDDYKRRSLPELKEYINENGHLPNIPKATVVEEEGILLGQMNTKMMEKIEELTLYIIELENRISELESGSKK